MNNFLIFTLPFWMLITACGTLFPALSPAPPPTPINFSLTSLDRVPPDDIAPEIMFYAGGAGGAANCKRNYSKPVNVASPEGVEVGQSFSLTTCGWQAGEKIRIELRYPDHSLRIVAQEMADPTSSGQGAVSYDYAASLADQPGVYQFRFKGEASTLVQEVKLSLPSGPRLYRTHQSTLVFYKFQPKEKIRLLVYLNSYAYSYFEGWIEVAIPATGNLILNLASEVEGKSYLYAAIGDKSGQVLERQEGWSDDEDKWVGVSIFCENAPPHLAGLGPNTSVMVIAEQLTIYHDLANMTGAMVIPKGTEIGIMGDGSPRCKNNMFWWGGGLIAMEGAENPYWIPEGNLDQYFVRVIK